MHRIEPPVTESLYIHMEGIYCMDAMCMHTLN